MPGHRSGVPEGEVDVLIAVDVHDPISSGRGEVNRMTPRPLVHPGHGHTAKKVLRPPEHFS
jgi:hypothetical protein